MSKGNVHINPPETHIPMYIHIDSIYTLSTCIYKSTHIHVYKGTRMNSNTCTYKYTTQLLGFWQGYPTKHWTKILLYLWETSCQRLNSHPRWTVDLKEKSGATALAEDTTEHLHEPRVADVYTSTHNRASASYKESTCLLGYIEIKNLSLLKIAIKSKPGSDTLANMDVTQNTMQPCGHKCWHILHMDLKASGWKKPDDNSRTVSDPS